MVYRKLITAISLIFLSMSAYAENPYAQPNDSWISISGTVIKPMPDSFSLDYGEGMIRVEMDDYDKFSETLALDDGDKVTVYGKVDDDLYEVTKIEADSVYVEDLNTYYHANAADEEDFTNWSIIMPIEPSEITYVGTVTDIHPMLGTFTVGQGENTMEVDVSPMPYDPLDDEGFHKIESGDRVSINGYIDTAFFTGHQLNAESITTLKDSQS